MKIHEYQGKAILKKYGVTADSPVIGAFIPIIRLIALDMTPPDHVVLAHAEQIKATQGV